ncbi:MAG: TonB-dependent receptor [Calditrichaeota bacterium]|nr:MAG: TonB-dependent receptor [Calditrichota bacterium]
MKKLFPYLFVFLNATLLFAGVTGKISGTVYDAETGEPLVGANVYLEGTTLGASTDADGAYIILHVPAGEYTVHAAYIGYRDARIARVHVQIDLTTTLEIKMESAALTTEEVVVVAKRPVIRKDMSNSQLSMDARTIEAVPVSTLNAALTLQAGIENSSRGLIIRGGGANETVVMMDGFTTNDERSNLPVTNVGLGNVREVQVLTGGFNAEYEQARSGVVNVVTRDGDVRFSGYMTMEYRPPAPKNFGISPYDKNSYFNRPYFDPDVMWTGTDNGAWDAYTQQQNVTFQGWETESQKTLLDDDPNNDMSPEQLLRLFEYYRRRDGRIKKGDYRFEAGLGGPLPFLNRWMEKPAFYLSHFQDRSMYVFPLSRDAYSRSHTRLKLTARPGAAWQVMAFAEYGETRGSSAYNWTPPTGDILQSVEEVAALPNSSPTGLSIPFMPGYFSPADIYRGAAGFKLTYSPDRNAFLETRLSFRYNRYKTFQVAPRDTGRTYELFDGFYVDEAPYGYWGYPANGPAEIHLGGWMNLGRDRSADNTFQLNTDYALQFNKWNEFKTGLSFVYNEFNINAFTDNPLFTTWRRSLKYHVFPYRLGLYAQDKLEFEGFIANVGFRLDYYDANTTVLDVAPFDDVYKVGQGDQISNAPSKDAQGRLIFSPRVGISHPISETAKLYFNYGHFRSEPASSNRFRLQQEYNGQTTYIGNPNLIPERTIAYEVGFEQSLFESWLIKVAGYYKDVSHQPGWIYYEGLNDTRYRTAASNNYADIRGLELTLRKRYGDWFMGFINYTYDVRSSGYFGLLQYYEDPKLQREYNKLHPVVSRRLPQPYASMNLVFFTPEEFGPRVMGWHPLDNWRLTLLGTWRTGSYYTYVLPDKPVVKDNTQWRDYYNLDLKLNKTWRLNDITLDVYVDVRNVLNTQYMSRAGFSDNFDWLNYLESLNFSWEEGVEKGNDRIGDYRDWNVAYDPLEPNPDNDPEIAARNKKRKETKSYIDMPNIRSMTFLNPRDIRFGVTIRF